MKRHCNMPRQPARSGFMLVECMVYVAVFTILVGIALETFYLCWNGFTATVSTTDDIRAALHAGELWRADVRGASGSISAESIASDQVIKIPEGGKQIIYSLKSGELRRQVTPNGSSQLVFAEVKSSEMRQDARNGVKAWQWELELPERQHGPHVPMLFTFEAAQKGQ
jgi:hypothetical protein